MAGRHELVVNSGESSAVFKAATVNREDRSGDGRRSRLDFAERLTSLVAFVARLNNNGRSVHLGGMINDRRVVTFNRHLQYHNSTIDQM